MDSWRERGDGEFTRMLDDGRVVKVFDGVLWRVTVDDLMVDNVFFDVVEAMRTVDEWLAGNKVLTFHPTERRWLGSQNEGYSRNSSFGPLSVMRNQCGNWKINKVTDRCFSDALAARRYADERWP